MDIDQLDRRINEIERGILRDHPTLDREFAKLDHVDRWHDATVFLLLAASAVFLMIGLSTMSTTAWVAGGISVATAFTVDARHERELQAARRSIELGLHPHAAVRPTTMLTTTTDRGESS